MASVVLSAPTNFNLACLGATFSSIIVKFMPILSWLLTTYTTELLSRLVIGKLITAGRRISPQANAR